MHNHTITVSMFITIFEIQACIGKKGLLKVRPRRLLRTALVDLTIEHGATNTGFRQFF